MKKIDPQAIPPASLAVSASYSNIKAAPFNEDWWLDITTGGSYSWLTSTVREDASISMPIYCVRRMGMNTITMPPYTRTLSPLLDLPPSKPFRRGQTVRHLVSALVADLPPYDSLRIRLEPNDETAFAFFLEGFNVSAIYTFSLPSGSDLSAVWENCDQKTRNLIRTARKRLTVTIARDFDVFAQTSIAQHANRNTHDFTLLRRLFEESTRHDQGTALAAQTEDGTVVASVLVVWGSQTMYFWQSAHIPAPKTGGANALLLWTAAEMAMARGLCFDFDGFGCHRNAIFIASFGLKPQSRLEVSRFNTCYGLAKLARSSVAAWSTAANGASARRKP